MRPTMKERREAYEMGYEYGKDVAKFIKESGILEEYKKDLRGKVDRLTIEEEALSHYLSDWWDGFIQSAEYSNFVLPDLRMLAGCRDEGYGTYQDCDEDAEWEIDEMISLFEEGFYDGVYENL